MYESHSDRKGSKSSKFADLCRLGRSIRLVRFYDHDHPKLSSKFIDPPTNNLRPRRTCRDFSEPVLPPDITGNRSQPRFESRAPAGTLWPASRGLHLVNQVTPSASHGRPAAVHLGPGQHQDALTDRRPRSQARLSTVRICRSWSVVEIDSVDEATPPGLVSIPPDIRQGKWGLPAVVASDRWDSPTTVGWCGVGFAARLPHILDRCLCSLSALPSVPFGSLLFRGL